MTMKHTTSKWSQISIRLLLTASALAHLNAADHPSVVVYGFFTLLYLSPFIAQNVLAKRSWLLTVNALTLGYLLFGIGQLFIIKVAPLNLASSFLLVLLTNKLLGPNTARDQLQLVLLSLLQMVISTALSSDLSVGVLLLAYALILPWTLVVLTFQSVSDTHRNETRDVLVSLNLTTRRKLRLLLSITGIGIVFATGLFFVLVPRLGFGLFAANPSQDTMTGFSSRVNLGDFGRIKTNRQTVMRVKVKDPNRLQQGRPYWRGISLDHYNGGHWSKSFDDRRVLNLPNQGFFALAKNLNGGIEQEIFLEPLDEKVLFGLAQINGLSTCPASDPTPNKNKFLQDQVGDLYYETVRPQTLRYCLTSRPVRLTEAHKKLTLDDYQRYTKALSDTFRRLYFQLPTDSTAVLDEVTTKIERNSDNVLEVIGAVESYLQTNYRYTLNRKTVDATTPIKDFLIDSPEGHCEYFASAMVLILRRLGIAARLVNGFAGGTVNTIGNYVLVHQGNAHSWVEVFLPEKRCPNAGRCTLVGTWGSFDPTPSVETTPELKSWWRDLIDASRLRWAEYVVRYNLRTQLTWMSDIFHWINAPETSKSETERAQKSSNDTKYTRPQWLNTLIAGIILTLVIMVLRRFSNQRSSKESQVDSQASRLYRRFTTYYQNQGVLYSPDMTAEEFLRQIQQDNPLSSPDALAFTTLYLQIRFAPSVDDVRQLERLLDLIEDKEPSRY